MPWWCLSPCCWQGHVWVHGPTTAVVWVSVHGLCYHQGPSGHSWFVNGHQWPCQWLWALLSWPSSSLAITQWCQLWHGYRRSDCPHHLSNSGELAPPCARSGIQESWPLPLSVQSKRVGPSGVGAGELNYHPRTGSRVLSWPTPTSTLPMSWCSIWRGWPCRTKALGSPWLRPQQDIREKSWSSTVVKKKQEV